jgi:hypothetical protein
VTADHVFFVLSSPPPEVSAEEYERWYDTHVHEVVALPGFVGAERAALDFVRSSSGEQPPFAYAVRYEIEGDFDAAMRELRAAVDGGRMSFPDWYPGVVSAGWLSRDLGRVDAPALEGTAP